MNCIPNRLLVIDDEATMCDFIGRAASGVGYEVRTTGDPDQFRTLLREFKPGMLIMDLNMPKIDGIELLELLGDNGYQGAVLVISGADPRVLAAADKSGALHGLNMLGALQKPVSLSQLQDALQTVRATQRVLTERDLRGALKSRRLILHYQPKIARQEASGWLIEGAEALVRWQHPEFGLLMPDTFIPLAEATGLITELTNYVIRAAVYQMSAWKERGLDVDVAVNVSGSCISDRAFPDRLADLLEEHGVENSRLILEVTENSAMKDRAGNVDVLARLRLKGIQLSIDDFGTGYSSLSQLFRMPFSELKIDRSFVAEIIHNAEAKAIVIASINLAHNLNMSVCAEGVESQEVLNFLEAEGCDKVQGYLISKPISATAFEELLKEQNGVAMSSNPLKLVSPVSEN